MNRKKMFTVLVAIGVAGMLVAIPYESNAIAPIIIAGIGVLAGASLALLVEYLKDKDNSNDDHTIDYTTNYTAYIQGWQNEFEYFDNQVNKDYANANNLISVYNTTKLTWIRAGEYETMYWLNKSSFDGEVQNATIEPLQNFTLGIFKSIWAPFVLDFYELAKEIEKVAGCGDDSVIFRAWKSGATDYILSQGGHSVDLKFVAIIINDDWLLDNYNVWDDEILNNNFSTIKPIWENRTGMEIYGLYVENTTDFEDMIAGAPRLLLCYDVDNTTKYIAFKITSQTANGNWYVYEDGVSNERRFSVIAGTKDYYYYRQFKTIDLLTSYQNIKTDVLANAQALWETYKNAGYDNVDDIPENETILFPDIALENIGDVLGENYSNAFPIWASIMSQLANSDMLNKSKINWNDFLIANFTGKYANITFIKYADSTNISNNTVLVQGHRCYIIPYETDLTIEAGKAYLIANKTAFGNAFDDIAYDVAINQHIAIYDMESGQFYSINPNSNTVYRMEVHNCYINGTEVNAFSLDVLQAGNFLLPEIYTNNSIPLPTFPGGDGGWLEQYKGLLTIASLVLGIILTAGTRKGTGGHTIGILLLVAGLGMAAYWYVLPAIKGISSFIDKLTFWS